MWCSREASRIVLISLNVFIILCGLGLGVAGAILRVASGFLHNEVVTLLNTITYDNVRVGDVATALWIIMVVAGGMIAMIGLLGVCGAWHSMSCCMVLYVTILILLAMAQVTAVGLWISVWTRTDEWMRGQLMVKLKTYQGPTLTDTVSAGFNTMFMNAACCGINAQYSASSGPNDFSALPATWYANRGTDYLPATCCQGVDSSTVSNFVGSDDCAATNPPINFYTKGCYDRLVDTVKTYSIIVIVLTGFSVVLEMISIWTSCILLKRNDNKIRSTDAGTKKNPPPYVGIDHVLKKKGRA